MLQLGLEKEVKDLVKKYGWEIPALQTIGYQEWQEYFEKKINKKDLKKRIKTHTIQFAKRQITWFKRFKEIYWTPPSHHSYGWAEKFIKEFLEIKKGRQI